ncbi:flagellar motor protein MotS [Halobacillus naozhouensis]|uniref:Flagellar motor protein MotS n=1 Tax=Halobacillus naozhouensis TaxID=554880 RepID=A0ABY8ITX0_9BACI|nr:flagellar motor protein MotS [Halobacillus naozhouensis]WFT73514.1 flagellar motor protein MotS [Halobacillus naozhouensis]
MKFERRRKTDQKGSPKWMTTYADMVTLILVFFILLFSMSQVNLVKFDAIAESFQNKMVFEFYPSLVDNENPTDQVKIQENGQLSNKFNQSTNSSIIIADPEHTAGQPSDLDDLLKEVNQYLESHHLQDTISASRTDQGIVLVLQEQLLFDSGEAAILEAGKPFLNKVGTLLAAIPNEVKVEGHTDNRPIATFKYPSNWELSGARAGSVIRYLLSNTEGLKQSRFTASAYADTRPVVPNNSTENWSKNRRVEIVILDTGISS